MNNRHLVFLLLILAYIMERSWSYTPNKGYLLVFIIMFGIYIYRHIRNMLFRFYGLLEKQEMRIEVALKSVCYLLFVLSCGIVLYRAWSFLMYPFQADTTEAFLLNEANMMMSKIFTPLASPPFYIGNYTFLYQLIYGLILKIIGHPGFFAGRLITILSTLGIAILIFKKVKGEDRNFFIPFFAAASFFTTWYVYENIPYVTNGVLSIFLGVLGLYWVDRYRDSKKVYWSALFFLMALYTKQSWVAAPFAGMLYLLLYKPSRGLKLVLGVAAGGGLILALVNYATDGEFFRHAFVYTVVGAPISVARIKKWYLDFGEHYFVITFFGFYYTFISIWRRKLSPWYIYLFFGLAVAAAIGREGAYVNYYWDMAIAFSITAGLSMKMILNESKGKHFRYTLILIIILYQFINLTRIKPSEKPPGYRFRMVYSGWSGKPDYASIDSQQKVLDAIKDLDGNVLSKEEYGLIALAGKRVNYHFFMERLKQYDEKNLLSSMKNGYYDYVLTRSDLSSVEPSQTNYFGTIKKFFKQYRNVEGYNIYKYNGTDKL